MGLHMQKDDAPNPDDPAAVSEPSPARPDRRRRLRAGAGRYLRARAADLFGDPGPLRAARDGFGRASAAIDLALDRSAGPADAGRPGWLWLPAPVLRRRHGAEASVARVFFSAAAVSVLVCGHRLWLADLAGAGASLGMAFSFAGFALRPAYRCHRLRARLAALDPDPSGAPDPERSAALDPRAFLRRPALWWPYPLPPAGRA